MLVPAVTLLLVAVLMAVEARLSARHERRLRARGAVEPPDDVFGVIRWAYPAGFVGMAAEGSIRGLPSTGWWMAGLLVFLAGKALKYWAIAALGPRWTFRVLVVPGEPLVTTGPYRVLRHPNYVGVAGELAGMALMMGALVSGTAAVVGFGALLRRRIRVEERMLASVAAAREPGNQSASAARLRDGSPHK